MAVDLNCELTITPVNGLDRMLTVDADYQTFEPVQSAACRASLPGSSGTSAVESRGEQCGGRIASQGIVGR